MNTFSPEDLFAYLTAKGISTEHASILRSKELFLL